MTGKSYNGEPTPQAAASRVDLAASVHAKVTYGETVTFRSDGKQFSWTFNGLGGRSVDVAKIAPTGFDAKPFAV